MAASAAVFGPAALASAPADAAVTAPGSADRGREIAHSRSQGLCVLCHALPGVPAHQTGHLGPSLEGVARRLSSSELRERLLNPQRFNPETIMPAYGNIDDGAPSRVASKWRGRPILDPQSIEDVLAYLGTLK